MNYSVIVEVTLRPGIADPEGATIERALPALGFSGVRGVRAGKLFRFDIEASDAEAARASAQSLSVAPPLQPGDRRRHGASGGLGRDAASASSSFPVRTANTTPLSAMEQFGRQCRA